MSFFKKLTESLASRKMNSYYSGLIFLELKRSYAKLGWWMTLSILALTVVVLSLLHHVGLATQLTSNQISERNLGDREHRFSVPIGSCHPSKECPVATMIPNLMSTIGANNSQVTLSTDAVKIQDQPDLKPRIHETQWNAEFNSARFLLKRGSWPKSDAEVVLSSELNLRMGNPKIIKLYGGLVSFRVAGIAEDKYFNNEKTIFSAPGTISKIISEISVHGERYSRPQISFAVQFNGGDESQIIIEVSKMIEKLTKSNAQTYEKEIASSYETRKENTRAWSAFYKETPLFAGWIPLLILPGLCVFVIIAGQSKKNRDIRKQLLLLGINQHRTTIVQYITNLIAIIFTIIFSIIVGDMLGYIFRDVIRQYAHQPLSPPLLPIVTLSFALVSAILPLTLWLLTEMIYDLWTARRSRKISIAIRSVTRKAVGLFRFLLLVAGAAWLINAAIFNKPSTASELSIWINIFCLVSAVFIAPLIAIYRDGPGVMPVPLTLAVRRMNRSFIATAMTACAVIAFLSVPVATIISTATSEYYINISQVAAVAPNQIALGMNKTSSGGTSSQIKKDFEEISHLSSPISLQSAWVADSSGQCLACFGE
ncbi:hypothetical protein KEM60_03037 [Austwickia sp. TVS 96-490-7B]|uniref:hypothetical protein n=1 Tax=Austwickia sp. TVS 96-490-7B TaxID=2830843 RepID=UPI001C58BED1|nr:hypothetical protein [Austwickia sp. TVS 96-490-7B]MBW3086808.1 hypothetical protein [Austwickia sp. TVS 96-490-7B]